jgi:hypothetical protein
LPVLPRTGGDGTGDTGVGIMTVALSGGPVSGISVTANVEA